MNLNICKKCMDNVIDIKIIDLSYYEKEFGHQIIFECYYKDGYSFQNIIWTNSQVPKAINLTKNILSKINIRSCSFAKAENNFSCPYIIEHQISDWNKEK